VKVTNEKTEQCQVYLKVEMEAGEVSAAKDKSYRKLVKKYKVPGFRQGKAPRDVLERFVGEGALLDDAINDMVPEACDRAIKEQEIEPVARPEVEISGIDPLVFQAIVPVAPVVKPGDYRSIRLKPEKSKFNKADVDKVIDDLRHQYAEFNPTEKAVASGDMAAIDVDSTVEGKPFIKQDGAQYQVIAGAPVPLPGFADQIIGLKRDEEKEFTLKLPDEYSNEEMAGKPAQFKVKVLEVKEEILPADDDELAKRVEQANPKVETMAELRAQISDNLKQKAEQAALNDFHEKLVTAVMEGAEVTFPPVMADGEVTRIIGDQMRQWQLGDNMEQYLKIIGKTEEELKAELRPMAEQRISRALVIAEISKAEKIDVSEEELKAEIAKLTESAGEHKAEMEKLFASPQYRPHLENTLISQKTMDRLEEIASDTKPATKSAAKKQEADETGESAAKQQEADEAKGEADSQDETTD